MSVGLLALLDDVAAIAKVAASSIDDMIGQAGKAGAKAAGVVIDDAAVTPRYVVGFSAQRELPIVAKIALGSLRNKLAILLPAALALSYFLPQAITPLLMIGGVYLCYEGAEKLVEVLLPHGESDAAAPGPAAQTPQALEEAKVAGAIKTDFILSAEIMAITLAAVPDAGFWTQAAVLAIVGFAITVAVYGAVALIVKADDVGVALARNADPSLLGRFGRALGRGLVVGMPSFLAFLSAAGTTAMIWVGGGIVVHGLHVFGLDRLHHLIESASDAAARAVPPLADAADWVVTAALSGIVGVAIGALTIPLVHYLIVPAWRQIKRPAPRPS